MLILNRILFLNLTWSLVLDSLVTRIAIELITFTLTLKLTLAIVLVPLTYHLHGRHFAHECAEADEHSARGEVRMDEIDHTDL